MKGWFLVAFFSAVFVLSLSTSASADVPKSRILDEHEDDAQPKPHASRSDDPTRGLAMGFGLFDAWYGTSPAFMLQGASAPRDLVGLHMPQGGARFSGFSLDIGASGIASEYDNSRFLVLRYMASTGSLASGVETANDAPVSTHMKSMSILQFEAPPLVWNGFQIADAGGRFRLQGYLGFGFSYASGTATIVSPRSSGDQDVSKFSLLLRPEVDGCLRLFTPLWACGTASASVYEFDWFSGVSAGVRAELVL